MFIKMEVPESIKITPTTVEIGEKKGYLLTDKDEDRKTFLRKICNIDPDIYDRVYEIVDNWTGGYFFIKGDKFRVIYCGSGVPIIFDKTGTLKKR